MKVASSDSGPMAKRSRTQAYTLVELMAVVVVMGTFAALAGPRINDQLVENRTGQIRLAVMRHLQSARSYAIGYGHAYRVVFDSGNQGTLAIARGSTNRCATSTWAPLTTYSVKNEQRGRRAVSLVLATPARDTMELCFQRAGLMYWRDTPTGRFSDRMPTWMNGGLIFNIKSDGSAMNRFVVQPFGGEARLLQ